MCGVDIGELVRRGDALCQFQDQMSLVSEDLAAEQGRKALFSMQYEELALTLENVREQMQRDDQKEALHAET